MKSYRNILVGLILSFSLMLISKMEVDARFQWKFPPLTELVVTDHYKADLGALSIGSHRIAGDLGLIQFFQYYGTRADSMEYKKRHSRLPQETAEEHESHRHAHNHWDAGDYPFILEYGKRIVRLDPFFHGAVLSVAGALAFNVERTDEALEYLKEAIERDPQFFRYRLYLGAILFKKEGKEEDLIRLLEEAIQFPDCPWILENILANLHKKYGNYEKAAGVYLHIIKQGVRDHEREEAKNHLLALLQGHPEIRPTILPLLEE